MKKNFIVNKKSKVVIAMMNRENVKCVLEEVLRMCSKQVQCLVGDYLFNTNLDKFDICEGDPFTGIAACDDKDEFDERVGREIASTKADMKYHTSMAKKYELIINLLDKATSEMQNLKDRHQTKADNIRKDLERCYLGVACDNSDNSNPKEEC